MSKQLSDNHALAVAREFTCWLRLRGESNPRRATLSLWLEINYNADTVWDKSVRNSADAIWGKVWQ